MKAIMANVVPIGRMGTSEELANAVLFLPARARIVYQWRRLFVDGGYMELR
jgi:NAD(P)-dependent dehydrogenase (short-subunit alcohol dehydrogenase family)